MIPANDVAVAHYNEITLKLGHRAMFVARLVQNIHVALEGLRVGAVRSSGGRVAVAFGGADGDEVVHRLASVPGIANVLPAVTCPRSVEAVERVLERRLATWRPSGSFRVAVRRADKSFPIPSPELAARLGALIVRATGAPVDLKHARDVVHVEVVADAIYVSVGERIEGCGGLPVSTGGRVLLLLSGGIDSPVAGLRMMRRGCRVEAVHFHSMPYLDGTSRDKARRLAGVLARGQGGTRLTLVAFGGIQGEIVAAVPRRLRVVLYRRMMMRIASRIARADECAALVTGESLGQVASQTLANMTVIERAAELPVLRPLVGMDKLEISQYAERAGTFEISIVPDQDCCTLFVPRHPATSASLSEVEEAEAALDVERMVSDSVRAAERERHLADWPARSPCRAAQV